MNRCRTAISAYDVATTRFVKHICTSKEQGSCQPPRAGSGASATEFPGPGPPCTYCVDRSIATKPVESALSLETIVCTGYHVRSPPSEAEVRQ